MKYIFNKEIHNLKSPAEIVPILLEKYQITSVLDVGTGVGTWLKEFENRGVSDVFGVDIQMVELSELHVSVDKVRQVDLSREFNLQRKFDLVLCLEVAEHIPEASADILVSSLVRHADLILFSAAIPNQGGQYHINEQWPDYWQSKFAKHDFVFYDYLRSRIWTNKKIDWWYRQNVFIVTKRRQEAESNENVLSLVHPEMLESIIRSHKVLLEDQYYGRIGFRLLFRNFIRSCLYRMKSIFIPK